MKSQNVLFLLLSLCTTCFCYLRCPSLDVLSKEYCNINVRPITVTSSRHLNKRPSFPVYMAANDRISHTVSKQSIRSSICFILLSYIIHMLVLSPLKSIEMSCLIPKYFPNYKGIDIILGIATSVMYVRNKMKASSPLSIFPLPWRRIQVPPIRGLLLLFFVFFYYLVTGNFTQPINQMLSTLSLTLPRSYSFNHTMHSRLATLFIHLSWVLPSIYALKIFIPGFIVIQKHNSNDAKYNISSGINTVERTKVKRYGLLRPKGSYKPVAMGGSDWFTFCVPGSIDSVISNTTEAVEDYSNLCQSIAMESRSDCHYDQSQSNQSQAPALPIRKSAVQILQQSSIYFQRIVARSLVFPSWLRWVAAGYAMSTCSVHLIEIIYTFLFTTAAGTAGGGSSDFIASNSPSSLSSTAAATAVVRVLMKASMSDYSDTITTITEQDINSIWTVLAGAIAPCVIAPIWEEMLYRGYVLPCLSHAFPSINFSIVLSSVLFAFHHNQFNIAFFQYFALSVIWSKCYLYSKNMLVPMLLHLLWNGEYFVYSLVSLMI